MKNVIRLALPLLLLACLAGAQHLTIDQIVAIKYPSAPLWSPDGHHMAFTWDAAGAYSLNLVDADHPSAPIQVATGAASAFWSHDGSTLYYPGNGTLLAVSASGGAPHPAWPGAPRASGFRLSPNGLRLAFVQGGGHDLVIRTLATGEQSTILHSDDRIGGPSWSPDGAHLSYTAGGRSTPHDVSPPEIGAKLIFRITEGVPGKLYVISAQGGAPTAVQEPEGGRGARWLNPSELVSSVVSPDYKTRTIYLLSATGGAPRAVHTDVEDKFWSMNGRDAAPQPSPDGKWILFGSDVSGWDQFYLMPAPGASGNAGAAVPLTTGDFDSWRATWSHDSRRIAFDANSPGRPGTRQLGVITVNGDPTHASVTLLTQGAGTNIAPEWSADDSRLVYQHADAQNSGDLFTIPAAGGHSGERLIESMPAGITHDFVAPELVHYTAADGQQVPAWLFVPRHLNRSVKHPAIVWIHPDGVNQNYDGWHTDRNEAVYYAFHQYLLQQGYVVIAPDYRGSIGYSRAWREGVFRDVGGQDATDARRAATYLQSLPYVDGSRIGVWGLSYGGYFTLRAITQQPTLFACAVDVAGLVDPAMYYQDPYHSGWMVSRMGTPSDHPGIYQRGETSTHTDRLQRPLLILAGTADVNVPFLETTLLLDQILKNGKGPLVSFMMYPGEFHYFDRAFVLNDAWRRVDNFFAAHLHPEAPARQ